ncbi:MAG: ABC transporter substrate-binding protein [Oscillospiraceae bacterium]|nr:ABC transporter substrate-binding protein [Oscillospiraceae bacterium]
MKTRTLASILAIFMVLTLLAGCNGSAPTSDSVPSSGETPSVENEKPYDLTLAITVGSDYPDQSKVTQAMQELVLKELNMNLNLVLLPSSPEQQLMLMLAGGEDLDVFPLPSGNAMSYISNGYIQDLGPLLEKHSENIKKVYGDEYNIANISGFVYAIPINKERDYAGGMIMRKDILDACGIDVGENCSKLTCLDDMTAIFAAVHEKFPNMIVFGGSHIYTPASIYLGRGIDNLGNEYGVLLDPANDTKLVNWFESEEYLHRVQLMREWYQAGYVQKDLSTSTDSGTAQMRAGNLFCDFDLVKPYRDVEAELATGYPCVVFNFDEPIKNGVTLSDGWCIASQSKNPEKAMEFLDWMYGSAEFMNLWNWGIEGEHWSYIDGNKILIDYPEGVDMNSVGYHQNRGWTIPNQFIAGIWNGNPADLANVMADYNKNMTVSKGYGFFFDGSEYETELANLDAIREKYAYVIGSGAVDPETEIANFNKELYDAGLQTIIDAKQAQFDAWLASK